MNKLSDIVSNSNWEALQDALASATQLALICVNYDGIPVTIHSGCHDFCRKVRTNPEYNKYCEKCDARGGFEALRSKRPYIYKCYLGIVDIAIPFIIDRQYVGSLMAGQVRISYQDSENIECILHLPHAETTERIKNELLNDFDVLPILSLKQIEAATQMLSSLCTFICQERNHSLARCQEILNTGYKIPEAVSTSAIIIKSTEDIERLQRINAITNGNYHLFSDVMKRAMEYIFSTNHHYPTLSATADICHISPSYLSRLFSKEQNESYNTFITRVKIEDAKDLLENSHVSINEISELLKYEDTGYFIKVFKKHTNFTPLNYRKLTGQKPIAGKY